MSFLRLARTRLPTASSPCLRTFATTPRFLDSAQQPVVLSRLQSDLKNAMRAKDKPRLNVLRAILADITNASKTAKPIENDTTLLALLQKQIAASEKAIEEFQSAKREDLVEKEKGQVEILQGYVNDIPKLGETDIHGILEEIKKELVDKEVKFGVAMKAVVEKIAGRPVDMTEVTRKLKEVFPGK